ncbi:hypothetical protein EDD22DRAFT_916284 [Suillus occidentalis]|nr:hypothetical protein EDD22DRAFT_916284 [Suillus occidentalis]
MDLSGGNNYSIIGYHDHNGPNQAWIFQQEDNGWFIKSVGADKYLGIEGDAEDAGNGTKVVASSTPLQVGRVSGIRILLHVKKFSVDLLWSRWHGANQIWALVERNW